MEYHIMNVDVCVLGAGPGGYVAAIRAAQLGLTVAIVDKRATAGGTCLNVGCIPSKALLHSSHKWMDVQHHMNQYGITVDNPRFDLAVMMDQKNKAVDALTKGVAGLFKKNNITFVVGEATIINPTEIKITGPNGEITSITTKNILIATGSEPTSIPLFPVDEKYIVTSTGALSLDKVPNHLIVVGGGVIGLEMGSVWCRLGAKVTVVEALDRITPSMDLELSKALQKTLTTQGMVFELGQKVEQCVSNVDNTINLDLINASGEKKTIVADVVLVSIGRRPFTDNLGLETVGVNKNPKGFIPVDHNFQTNIPGIYAIGDVIGGAMLAHKAEDEGFACANIMAGKHGHVNYDAIPSVIYTMPEVASVGKSEENLKSDGIEYKVGKFPFLANSRARAIGQTEGFVKVLTDAKTDRVLGVHIIGELAGTMIAEAVLAMEFKASAEDIALTCHAHPTHMEALKEAAMAAHFKPIHM
jgi:dihydrolipoamide dehydrogenase